MIQLTECKHGYLYKIYSRNLTQGVFNKNTKGFVGIRDKFGREYLFTEFHWDTGAPFGTVKPIELIEKCPVDNIEENLGSICENCGKDVEYTFTGYDLHGIPIGSHKHVFDTDCGKIWPVSKKNDALFDYLIGKQNELP